MALSNQAMAGLLNTHQGLLGGLRESLAPVAPPDTNDPASLRIQAAEMARRGRTQEAAVFTNMANALERQEMVKQQQLQNRTDQTLARADRRTALSRAQVAEGDAMLAEQQALEKFAKSKTATAAALRKQGREGLADIVDAIEDPATMRGLMSTIAAERKENRDTSGWTKVETGDGVFAVDQNDPSKKVRIGDLKPSGKLKGDKEAEAPGSIDAATRADRYTGVFTAMENIEEKLEDWSPIKQGTTGWMWGSEARSINNDLKTLKGNAAFDRLQQMRDESKTGGALGQVSNIELQLLESTITALDPTDADFKRQLATIKGVYQRTRALDDIVTELGEDNIAELKKLPNGYRVKTIDGKYYERTY